MSYYQSQAGDYKTYGYAGDPGFFSSLWRGVKRIAGPIIGGLIAGPAGAALGGALTGPKPAPPMQFPVPTAGGGFPIVGQVTMPGGASFSAGVMVPGRGRLPPFTARGPGVIPGGGRGGQMIPSGYHFAKDGSGRLVRNRRMNVANPRALRRSMRRVQGFEKLARRTITFTRRVKMRKRKSS